MGVSVRREQVGAGRLEAQARWRTGRVAAAARRDRVPPWKRLESTRRLQSTLMALMLGGSGDDQ
jgi:hypothetical protein